MKSTKQFTPNKWFLLILMGLVPFFLPSSTFNSPVQTAVISTRRPMTDETWLLLLLVMLLILSSIVVWRWRRSLFYQHRFEAAAASQAVAQADAAMLRNLAAHVPGVIYQYRYFPDGRSCFPYASDGIKDIYGVTPAEVKEDATPVFKRLYPDDYDEVVASIVNSYETITPWHHIYRAILPERGVRWLEGNATPQRLTDGSVLWHGFITDVTERKEAEKSLRESERRYRTLYNQSIDAIFLHDLNGRILDINQTAITRSGYTKEELLQMTVFDLHPDPTDKEEILSAWPTWPLNKQHMFVIEHQRKDGSIYPVEVSAGKVAFDGQTLMLAIVRDITERAQQEAAIRQEQQRYQALFEQAHDAILIADDKGNYLDANPAACELLGYQQAELLQQSAKTIVATTPTEETDQLWQTFIDDSAQWGELWLRHRQGHTIPVEYRAVANFLPGHHLSVLRDISARKAHEQQLLETLTTLKETQNQLVQQERLAAVGQLAAGIAHDFNNILAVILLYAQMLEQTPNLPAWEQKATATIVKQTKIASNLVTQILDFSRKSILERTPVNWLVILKEQMQLLERTLPENIDLTFRYDSNDGYTVLGDVPRLQQMILNLAFNSRDAMPNGGELIFDLAKVSIDEAEGDLTTGQWIRLRVKDTGDGIATEDQPYVFEPFFTTKEPGKGSGLGLAQVQGIVAQHDGHVILETSSANGTLFTLYLPAVAETPPPETKMAASLVGQQELILLVEDNHTVREAIKSSLEALNYRVVAVGDGRAATAVLNQQADQIDLIVSDLIMPVMGGTELFDYVQRQGWSIPVVIMTGHHLNKTLDGLLEQGLRGWATKPLTLQSLAELVENGLSQKDVGSSTQ